MVCINENKINETEYFIKYDNSFLEQYNDLFLIMYTYLQRYRSIEGYVNLTIKDFLLYHAISKPLQDFQLQDAVF